MTFKKNEKLTTFVEFPFEKLMNDEELKKFHDIKIYNNEKEILTAPSCLLKNLPYFKKIIKKSKDIPIKIYFNFEDENILKKGITFLSLSKDLKQVDPEDVFDIYLFMTQIEDKNSDEFIRFMIKDISYENFLSYYEKNEIVLRSKTKRKFSEDFIKKKLISFQFGNEDFLENLLSDYRRKKKFDALDEDVRVEILTNFELPEIEESYVIKDSKLKSNYLQIKNYTGKLQL
jgi:hypothetical protein